MRPMLLMDILMPILTAGCGSGPEALAPAERPVAALCARLEPLATQAAAGVVADGGPVSRRSVARLLAGVDGGCGAVR